MEKKYPWNRSRFGKKQQEPVQCVYAGPEYFSKKDRPPMEGMYAGLDAHVPQQQNLPDDPAAMGDVYAGPQPPDAPPFMAVYAGPTFYDPSIPQAGAYAPVPAPEPKEIPQGANLCPDCGAPFTADAKFCSECGRTLKP
ncbi:MAG: hypothetical protein IJT41_12455 [Clostridia bacterium]|nr:hypothetical protein [Clostridia bacterium]